MEKGLLAEKNLLFANYCCSPCIHFIENRKCGSKQGDFRSARDIELGGFAKSWDHWLFLTLAKGNEKVIRLHDELYEGILAPYLRRDIQFIPHIGLGEFVKEKEMGLLRRKQLGLRDPSRIAFSARYIISHN